MDWKSLPQVKAYADRLGPGMTVFKLPSRQNYNITHTSREGHILAQGGEILYRT
jgi:hypothetical protein